ncbi:hypothetical protein JZU68_05170, partial [bacterium]|nr:hypothetical protein [bacterium]
MAMDFSESNFRRVYVHNFHCSYVFPVYTQFLHTDNPYSIPENSIYSITQDNVSGKLWVLSQMGLSVISDSKNVVFERINALELFSDASNFLNHIMKDRQGNIWIATSN